MIAREIPEAEKRVEIARVAEKFEAVDKSEGRFGVLPKFLFQDDRAAGGGAVAKDATVLAIICVKNSSFGERAWLWGDGRPAGAIAIENRSDRGFLSYL